MDILQTFTKSVASNPRAAILVLLTTVALQSVIC